MIQRSWCQFALGQLVVGGAAVARAGRTVLPLALANCAPPAGRRTRDDPFRLMTSAPPDG